MPDTLEMPYRPDVFQIFERPLPAVRTAARRRDGGESYAVAGGRVKGPSPTAWGRRRAWPGTAWGLFLAESLSPGDELVFDDMAHYDGEDHLFSTACAIRT